MIYSKDLLDLIKVKILLSVTSSILIVRRNEIISVLAHTYLCMQFCVEV